jgi:hypothetical protein
VEHLESSDWAVSSSLLRLAIWAAHTRAWPEGTLSEIPISLLVVEDNARLRPALVEGFNATGVVHVLAACESGEEALESCLRDAPQAILMDVPAHAGRLLFHPG